MAMGSTRLFLVFCIALVVCGCRSMDRTWIVGAEVGHTSTGLDTCNTDACSISGTKSGGKVFGGYQFNRYLAFEAGLVSLGTITQDTTTVVNFGLGPATVTHHDSGRKIGPFYNAVGTWPITKEFGLLGRAGVGVGGGPEIGAGLKYDLSRKFGVRIEYQRFYGSGPLLIDWHTDLFSTGLVYYFR